MTKHENVTYLDANASELIRPEAREAVIATVSQSGNPSSIHAAGRLARHVLETSRTRIAASFGARPQEVVFCSGATEANAMAIHGLAPGRRVLIGATEHDAVRAAAPESETLPVTRAGALDLDALRAALHGGPALVCAMLANNETGVLHPIAEIAALCRAAGALLHIDAVQAAGRMTVDCAALGADTLALSAHKLGGPMGAGALILRTGIQLPALIAGGGQERGQRGGTPALPAIAGFAAAAQAACRSGAAPLAPLRDGIEAAATAEGAIVCGGGARLANTTCLALPGVAAQTQVMALDLAGFAVSAGAACSSGRITPSHVLLAMGLGPLAASAIRVSLPWNARPEDAAAFADAYRAMALRLGRAA